MKFFPFIDSNKPKKPSSMSKFVPDEPSETPMNLWLEISKMSSRPVIMGSGCWKIYSAFEICARKHGSDDRWCAFLRYHFLTHCDGYWDGSCLQINPKTILEHEEMQERMEERNLASPNDVLDKSTDWVVLLSKKLKECKKEKPIVAEERRRL